MKIKVTCDWCGREYMQHESELKRTYHHFCCRQCSADFSNKKINPEGYKTFRDFDSMSRLMTQRNLEDNPMHRGLAARLKNHEVQKNRGLCKTYSKFLGRHEHRVVAEQILGRPLRPGEIVHHEDGNKRNNDPKNIYVFPSRAEHCSYHARLYHFFRDLDRIEAEEAVGEGGKDL